jgi:hypothetical protein
LFPQKKKPQPGMTPDANDGLPAPKPFERKDEPEEAEEMAQHEAAESPEYEAAEEQGADILADLEAVGQRYGADKETAHALAADFCDAISKCLRGGKGPKSHEMGGDDIDATVDTYE